MGKTRWTDEQLSAIQQHGDNIIVSAGAGSGKTAVLTERIIEKLKQGISLDSLIVLTFTNAAAFEMKERVRAKLNKELEKGHLELLQQLDLLDSANICTFDSFSLSLVKKYHYLLDLEKNINICDSVVLVSQKKKILEEVFLEFYQKKDLNFLSVIDTFTIKDDTKIKKIVYQIAEGLSSIYDKETYMSTYLKRYYDSHKIEKDILSYVEYIIKELDEVFLHLDKMEQEIMDEKLIVWYEQVVMKVESLRNVKTYDQLIQNLPSSLPSFPTSKKIEEEEKIEVKKEYDILRKSFHKVKEYCTYKSTKEIRDEILKTKKTVDVLLSLVKQYETKVSVFKRKYNVFEFSDIGRFAVQILEQYPSIRKTYRENIHEIMVDEYQDTNDIGDSFISLLSNQNIYMVGDVKQSIYGFRNANPSIFMEKYETYQKQGPGIKIDLMKNFRSRREVLNCINLIFEQIMNLSIGGADYTNGHEMIFGNEMYESEGKTEDNYSLEVLEYPYQKGEYKKEEIEAFLIASDIQKKIKTKYQVIDKETSKLRPVTYQDFAILMDRKTDFDLYKKIFTYLEIPIYIHKEENFIQSDEIFVIQNILKILDCMKMGNFYDSAFSHSFLSVARSFLFAYEDDVIFDVFFKAKQLNRSIYHIFRENENLIDMKQKIDTLYQKLPILSLRELLEEMYIIFDFYNKIIELGEVDLLSSKLHYLLEVATSLENLEYTLSDMISYFDSALKHQIDIHFEIEGTYQDAIEMMTIHKSKGLEFPICYYSGIYKTFSKEDFKDRFLFNRTYGIVTPVFEEGLKDTIYKTLVREEYYQRDVSEKIRLLYVALTRAREKIIIVTPSLNTNIGEGALRDEIRLKYRSFYDMFSSIKNSLLPYIHKAFLEEISLTHEYDRNFIQSLEIEKSTKEGEILPIELRISTQKMTKEHYSAVPNFMSIKDQENIEIGRQIHTYLENIDFLNRQSFYKEYHVSDFYIDKIEGLFEAEFMKNLDGAIFYKEYEFVYDQDHHGIIDLLIQKKDSYIVVDYKLKDIQKEAYYQQIKGYMTYVQQITMMPVSGYLYSLLDKTYMKIESYI